VNHHYSQVIVHPLSVLQSPLLSLTLPFPVLRDYSLTMVGSTLAMRSNAMQLSSLSRRSLTTRSPVQALRSSQSLSLRTARRPYSDAAPLPAPKPKKRFRFLRWTWRLTLLAGVGLAGNLAYSIYDQRHPTEQFVPDPSKKTLVILGRFASCSATAHA
jgi:NADH:ubiquinone reductase (non-electrogenic)